jgi:hypothetical protein
MQEEKEEIFGEDLELDDSDPDVNDYTRHRDQQILTDKPKKQKHNYTSELELKSLLIRIKNKRESIGIEKDNVKINKYIKWHTAVNNKKYDAPAKRNILKTKLKERIVTLSEATSVDTASYERFGEIILLMVKNILKKPQFSGYTYKDDFYSDAVYKILKYLHNFNHKMISDRTGLSVNAFAYISQIIHNSILFIINSKKKDLENLRKQISMEHLNHDLQPKNGEYHVWDDRSHTPPVIDESLITETVYLKKISNSLVEEIAKLESDIERVDRLDLYYPKDYKISMEEYNLLSPMLRGKISIMRAKE